LEILLSNTEMPAKSTLYRYFGSRNTGIGCTTGDNVNCTLYQKKSGSENPLNVFLTVHLSKILDASQKQRSFIDDISNNSNQMITNGWSLAFNKTNQQKTTTKKIINYVLNCLIHRNRKFISRCVFFFVFFLSI
jgi:hypothetical protein